MSSLQTLAHDQSNGLCGDKKIDGSGLVCAEASNVMARKTSVPIATTHLWAAPAPQAERRNIRTRRHTMSASPRLRHSATKN
jgi:hypothetical protein